VPGGINESGLATISSRQANDEKGYVYSGGFYVFMIPPGWTSSNATAINNSSQVVGHGVSPAGRRSFLRTGTAYEEISFPGWTSTEAVSLNDLGHVTGSGETASGETHAFLASPGNLSTPAAGSGDASTGSPGGGGCSMAAGGSREPFTASAAMSLLALLLPLLPPLVRGVRNRIPHSRDASGRR
jgi:probable HAF family extracellular repeat protein